jgi:hyperosmotically inducible periplasmic protein
LCGAIALAAAIAGCDRAPKQDDAKRVAADVASDVKAGTQKAADAWVITKIQSKFVGDRDIKATDIDVSARDGVVTLKGRVLNEPIRSLAVSIAKNTDGVTQVVDQLSLITSGPIPAPRAANPSAEGAVATTGYAIDAANRSKALFDDARITSSIQAKYFLDDNIKGRKIDVDTSNGVVTLRGEVGGETERGQALLLARTTEGVTRVEDSLTVTAGPSDDNATSTRIQSALAAAGQLKGASVAVTARSGLVLLEGTAPSAAAKQHALDLARESDGVTQVIDRIRISKGPIANGRSSKRTK